mmetsp:Transcript_4512/g.10641  ORF Transcript_4512/g.10641 Transcript_4512/m.10641 type:complete len:222 (+) Transcript_4512:827-1492(+)
MTYFGNPAISAVVAVLSGNPAISAVAAVLPWNPAIFEVAAASGQSANAGPRIACIATLKTDDTSDAVDVSNISALKGTVKFLLNISSCPGTVSPRAIASHTESLGGAYSCMSVGAEEGNVEGDTLLTGAIVAASSVMGALVGSTGGSWATIVAAALLLLVNHTTTPTMTAARIANPMHTLIIKALFIFLSSSSFSSTASSLSASSSPGCAVTATAMVLSLS